MWFNQYPYINLTDLNLDFIYKSLKELRYQLENFVNINTIKYADPIQWNITTQYEANTVVIDPNDGTAYLSTNPVPKGVAITNTDYWTPIFTLNLLSANQNITLRDDGSNVLATFASVAGDWLIWNNTLYKVSQPINVNEAYVVGYNIDRYSVELFISDYITEVKTMIGDLGDLTTVDNSSVVNAINELVNDLGDITTLDTTDKTSVVNAINEIFNTGGKTFSNLKIFNVKDYGATGDGIADDTTAIQDALNAAESDGGVVYFPIGTYDVTDTLKAGYGVSLYGENVERTIIHRNDSSTGDTLQIGDESTQNPASSFIVKNIWFKRDIIFDESNNTFTNKISNSLAHLRVYKGQQFRIENCRFWDMPYDVVLLGCTVGTLEKCWFRPSIYYPTFTGKTNLQESMAALKITKPSSESFQSQLLTVNDCYFSGRMTSGQYTQNCLGVNITNDWQCGAMSAIEADCVESLIISDSYFGGFGQNVNLYNLALVVSEVRIVNNMFDSGWSTDIMVSNPLANGGVTNLTISDNVFNSQLHGYNNINMSANGAVFGAKNVTITNNIFSNSKGNCIMPTGIQGGVIANNRFTAYNAEGDYDNAILGNTGLYVFGITDHVDIHDNFFGGAVNTADYSAHCVNGVVIANGVSAGVLVNNNRGYVSNLVENDQR